MYVMPPSKTSSHRLPSQEKPRYEPGREIQDKIHNARWQPEAEILFQVFSAIFQSKHEEQQEHADLRPSSNESPTKRKRRQTAIAEGETSQ